MVTRLKCQCYSDIKAALKEPGFTPLLEEFQFFYTSPDPAILASLGFTFLSAPQMTTLYLAGERSYQFRLPLSQNIKQLRELHLYAAPSISEGYNILEHCQLLEVLDVHFRDLGHLPPELAMNFKPILLRHMRVFTLVTSKLDITPLLDKLCLPSLLYFDAQLYKSMDASYACISRLFERPKSPLQTLKITGCGFIYNDIEIIDILRVVPDLHLLAGDASFYRPATVAALSALSSNVLPLCPQLRALEIIGSWRGNYETDPVVLVPILLSRRHMTSASGCAWPVEVRIPVSLRKGWDISRFLQHPGISECIQDGMTFKQVPISYPIEGWWRNEPYHVRFT